LNQTIEEQDNKLRDAVGSGDSEALALMEEKGRLRAEIGRIHADHEEELQREKDRHADTLLYEIRVLTDGYEEKLAFLDSQVLLYKATLDAKTEENDRLVAHIARIREVFASREEQLLA
jgi:hypothetical protein